MLATSLPPGKAGKTMEKILDSAEMLFLEQGFNGASLRTITQDANVNLASVNYHFGSKEALLKAVLLRRLVPYLELTTVSLQTLMDKSPDYQLSDVVLGLLLPLQNAEKTIQLENMYFIRLISRMLIDQPEMVYQIVQGDGQGLIDMFLKLVSTKIPEVSESELLWRAHFTVKLLFHAYSGYDIFGLHKAHPEVTTDSYEITQQLVPFLAFALAAPAHNPNLKMLYAAQ